MYMKLVLLLFQVILPPCQLRTSLKLFTSDRFVVNPMLQCVQKQKIPSISVHSTAQRTSVCARKRQVSCWCYKYRGIFSVYFCKSKSFNLQRSFNAVLYSNEHCRTGVIIWPLCSNDVARSAARSHVIRKRTPFIWLLYPAFDTVRVHMSSSAV